MQLVPYLLALSTDPAAVYSEKTNALIQDAPTIFTIWEDTFTWGGSGFSFFAGNMAAVAPINKRQVGTQCQCLSGETPVWQPGRLRILEPMRRTKMPWFTGTQVNRSGSKLDTWTIPVEKTSPFMTCPSLCTQQACVYRL